MLVDDDCALVKSIYAERQSIIEFANCHVLGLISQLIVHMAQVSEDRTEVRSEERVVTVLVTGFGVSNKRSPCAAVVVVENR